MLAAGGLGASVVWGSWSIKLIDRFAPYPFGMLSPDVLLCITFAIAMLFGTGMTRRKLIFGVGSAAPFGVALVGSALLLVGLANGGLPYYILGIAIISVVLGVAGLYLDWGSCLFTLKPTEFFSAVFIAAGFEGLGRAAVLFLFNDFALNFVLPGLLAVACGCLYGYSRMEMNLPERNSDIEAVFSREELPRHLWRLSLSFLIGVTVWMISFLAAPVYPIVYQNLGLLGYLLCTAAAFVLTLLVLFRPRPVSFGQIWRYLTMAFAVLLVLMVFPETASFQKILSKAVGFILTIIIWLASTDLSRRSDLHPAVFTAGAWCAYYLAASCAHLVSDAIGVLTPEVNIVLLCIICISGPALLNEHNTALQYIFSDFAGRQPVSSEFFSIEDACKKAGEHHGLTDREVEIMTLICQGRSKAYIAETLFLSVSTVQGHSRNLYRKCGVHSKQELQDLIGL